MNRPKVLFHAPAMKDLARNIVSGSDIQLGEIDWSAFNDGWPNLFIKDIKKHRGSDAYFLASFSTPAEIFAQMGVIYALPRYEVNSLTVILPFFSTGTMERVEVEGEIATAMTLARMFDAIPDGGPGFGRPRLVFYDIHALPQRFYFHNALPRLETAIPLLLIELEKLKKQRKEEIAIAFPDDGAHKRFGKMFAGFPQIICGKVRQGDERIVTIKEGDPRGRYVVIIDDLVQSGGTLLECGKTLKEAGCELISAFVTHAIFPNESWRGISGVLTFDKFWLTDSCPQVARQIHRRGPFEVLSLAPLIQDMIRSDNKYS